MSEPMLTEIVESEPEIFTNQPSRRVEVDDIEFVLLNNGFSEFNLTPGKVFCVEYDSWAKDPNQDLPYRRTFGIAGVRKSQWRTREKDGILQCDQDIIPRGTYEEVAQHFTQRGLDGHIFDSVTGRCLNPERTFYTMKDFE